MQRLLESLDSTGQLPKLAGSSSEPEQDPQAKQWVLFYLAQHYDKLGQTGTSQTQLWSNLHVQFRCGFAVL